MHEEKSWGQCLANIFLQQFAVLREAGVCSSIPSASWTKVHGSKHKERRTTFRAWNCETETQGGGLLFERDEWIWMDTSWSLTKAGATEILAQIAGNKGGNMKFPKRKTISRVWQWSLRAFNLHLNAGPGGNRAGHWPTKKTIERTHRSPEVTHGRVRAPLSDAWRTLE